MLNTQLGWLAAGSLTIPAMSASSGITKIVLQGAVGVIINATNYPFGLYLLLIHFKYSAAYNQYMTLSIGEDATGATNIVKTTTNYNMRSANDGTDSVNGQLTYIMQYQSNTFLPVQLIVQNTGSAASTAFVNTTWQLTRIA